jgi:aminopeptidase YwaD
MNLTTHIERSSCSLTCLLLSGVLFLGCATGHADDQTGQAVRVQSEAAFQVPESDTGMTVDAQQVNLRQILEDLGPDAITWYQHVQTLANPFFEGRVNGSAGTEHARDYVEFYFRLYGLEPAFDEAGGSYRQPFQFSTRGAMTVTAEDLELKINGRTRIAGKDFSLVGDDGEGKTVKGPVTFVGYSIENGPDAYSSFDSDTDLSGRVALMLRYEPLDEQGVSRWDDERFSRHAAIYGKLGSAAERGAIAVVLVTPPGCRDAAAGLEADGQWSRFTRSLGIPVVHVTPAIAQEMLAQAGHGDGNLMAWRKAADAGAFTTVDLPDAMQVELAGELVMERNISTLDAVNMAATLPGRGTLADEYIMIGGHYDHNGWGWFGTSPDQGDLFPGADDNASGVAGMLVLAQRLAKEYAEAGDDANLRSVMFLAFDAEERGLHGSRFFAEHMPVDPKQVALLFNFDMIGRLRGDRLTLLGTQTGKDLEAIMEPHIKASGLTVGMIPRGSNRSDDANFHRQRIAAIHVFTGMTPEYTSPQDQAYTVNPRGAVKVLNLMHDIAMDVASRKEMLAYHAPTEGGRGQDRGYARVRLGIRPGQQDDLETGILVEGVSEGTSAADGGIKPGDIMLSWNGVELDGMRALFESLQQHEPGDVVKIVVRRGEEEIELDVTLKASRGEGRPRG